MKAIEVLKNIANSSIDFGYEKDAIESIKEIESIKKENIRLKKQLSKGHHIECSCSFCKPVACSYVDNNSSEMW